jgi:ABC-type uncharacterized transport system involved in gliding motility auxiliary subunit
MSKQTLGKLLGAIGLILLLSSPFTFLITSQSSWLALGKLLVGVTFIGVFFATNVAQLGQFASRKSTFFFVSAAVTGVVLLALLSALNYIAAKKNVTWDLTKKKIYTLSPQTVSTLKGLKEKVRAIGFLPTSHPAYDALDSLLQRYHLEAPDKFEHTFKDPLKFPDLASKYSLKEGQATVVLSRGEGAAESHTTLNVVSEQDLTNALIKINSVGEQKAYFVTGHGEWSLESSRNPLQEGEEDPSISELIKEMSQEGYVAAPLNLAGEPEVPKDAALLIIAGAKSTLSPPEIQRVEKYLDEGGRMILFADATVESGLDTVLSRYGVQIDPGIVADNRYMSRTPYVVIAPFFGEHEITRELKARQLVNLQFPTSRGLTLLRQGLAEGVKAEPVVLTSPYAWVETQPDDTPSPTEGEKTGQVPLVTASTRNTSNAQNKRYDEARLVVFGDSELIVDVNWGHEPNRNLVLNSFAWASNQVNKITLRPPDRDISTVELSPALLSNIRFVAVDLLPVSLLSIGIAIWLARRNQ